MLNRMKEGNACSCAPCKVLPEAPSQVGCNTCTGPNMISHRAEPEVDELHLQRIVVAAAAAMTAAMAAAGAQEHEVFGLDVPVDYAARMHVRHCRHHTVQELGGLLGRHRACLKVSCACYNRRGGRYSSKHTKTSNACTSLQIKTNSANVVNSISIIFHDVMGANLRDLDEFTSVV